MTEQSEIKFVTIATHSERYYPVLQESARRHGIDLRVLAWGEEYTGHYMKDDLMIDYLEKELQGNPIVIFVDGFDSVFLTGPEEFQRKYLEFEANLKRTESNTPSILVSRDFDPSWLSAPISSYCYWRVFNRCDGMYINAGLFGGRRQALLKFLKQTVVYRNCIVNSNQIIWSYTYLDQIRNQEDRVFGIDQKANVFLNFCHVNTRSQLGLRMVDDRLEIKKRNDPSLSCYSRPCVISGPGSSDMDQILIDLGYSNFEAKSLEGQLSFGLQKIPYYIKAFYPEMITGVGVIVAAGLVYRLWK